MELIIVSGFVVFLPKYLETQFSLGKSQASVFTGDNLDIFFTISPFNNYLSSYRFHCDSGGLHRNFYGRLYFETYGT